MEKNFGPLACVYVARRTEQRPRPANIIVREGDGDYYRDRASGLVTRVSLMGTCSTSPFQATAHGRPERKVDVEVLATMQVG